MKQLIGDMMKIHETEINLTMSIKCLCLREDTPKDIVEKVVSCLSKDEGDIFRTTYTCLLNEELCKNFKDMIPYLSLDVYLYMDWTKIH